jgi:hypothetical protein
MASLSRRASEYLSCVIVSLAAAASQAPLAAQQPYGFVVRLGRDTVAVERVNRSADHLAGDVVERTPAVVLRHYEAVLAPDGQVLHFVVDSREGTPQPGRPASQHVSVDFLGDSLRVTTGVGDGATVTAFPTAGVLAMPWLTTTYGTTEQLVLAALGRPGDSVPVILYLPEGRLAGILATSVHRYGRDSASLSYRAMPIMVQLDRYGRIASLSGERTTNKVRLTRLDLAPDIEAITTRFVAAERAAGGAPVAWSVRDTVRASIGNGRMVVEYSRPQLRGRSVIGGLVPLDSVWRTGADEATQFSTTVPMTLAGMALAPGRYSLWVKLTAAGPILIVNRETGQWGTDYVAANDLARAPLQAEQLAVPVEIFTIRMVQTGDASGRLTMEWDRFRWTAEIALR